MMIKRISVCGEDRSPQCRGARGQGGSQAGIREGQSGGMKFKWTQQGTGRKGGRGGEAMRNEALLRKESRAWALPARPVEPPGNAERGTSCFTLDRCPFLTPGPSSPDLSKVKPSE